MRKILVLQGSPRVEGNTAALAKAFVEGVEMAGHEVHYFDVASMRIAGCDGCHVCWEDGGNCVIDDDMQTLYPLIDSCDTLVIATPVYFFSFSAQIKAAIDRMEAKMGGAPRSIRSSVLLTTYYQAPDSGTIEPVLALYQKIVSYLGWHDEGVIAVPYLDEPDDIAGDPALEEARKLGSELA